MCRLITQPGDQWAYPGIVLLSVFDGVSLRAQSCRQKDILPVLTQPGEWEGSLGKANDSGTGVRSLL